MVHLNSGPQDFFYFFVHYSDFVLLNEPVRKKNSIHLRELNDYFRRLGKKLVKDARQGKIVILKQ